MVKRLIRAGVRGLGLAQVVVALAELWKAGNGSRENSGL